MGNLQSFSADLKKNYFKNIFALWTKIKCTEFEPYNFHIV